MSYKVVEEFERAIAAYTGAPYVVTVNSCSSALLLACIYFLKEQRRLGITQKISFPRHTYCSAPMAALHAGAEVIWDDREWTGAYRLAPLPVWDSARRFRADMYRYATEWSGNDMSTGGSPKLHHEMVCVSFQTSKILGLEQGGAILHDNAEADEWLRRARFDGRLDASEKLPKQIGMHCYLSPSVAALGLQHLACLPLHNDDQAGSEDFPDLSLLDIWP